MTFKLTHCSGIPIAALVRRVKRGEHPPCRPFVSRATANDEVIDLMIICWDEIPYFRPSFPIICDSLKKIRMSLGTCVLI